MGRVLTVRLSAETYNDDDVFRAWPQLCALAWPGKGEVVGGAWRAAPRTFASPVPSAPQRHGVRELARDLLEESQFGDWNTARAQRLANGLAALADSVKRLDAALADWQPQAANAASDAVEDALDSLEKASV